MTGGPERDRSRPGEPARQVRRAVVTEDALDAAEHARLVEDPAAGAVVGFTGIVRDHDLLRPVTFLEYEAHPGASAVLAEIVGRLAAEHPVDAVAVSHRVGGLAVGEIAFVVAVSAAHRREAFEACEQIVEAVKRELPVWKHQRFADGSAEWVHPRH